MYLLIHLTDAQQDMIVKIFTFHNVSINSN